MADHDAPDERARVHWSVPPPPPGAPVPEVPSEEALGDEFLFHLYRGSELLQEDQVYLAKSELERALAFQPKDVEGQSLLGVTYFRLGHYPRAIQIYEELVRVRPEEVAPRVNLGLCYLKTGQLALARQLLEELVTHRPEHTRAWGYLGLTYQRLGDADKAAVAFERSGRPQLAARLRATGFEANRELDPENTSGVQEITQAEVRAAPTVPPPPAELSEPRITAPPPSRRAPSGAWPAPGTRVSVPAPLDRVTRDAALVFPERPRVVVHESGVVLARIEHAFQVRSDCLRALFHDSPGAVASQTLYRRGRGFVGDDPLGGTATPFVTLTGRGRLMVQSPAPFHAWVSTLDGDPFYVREDRLLGFDAALPHATARMTLTDAETTPIVQLSGSGFVILATEGCVHGLEVAASRPIEVRVGQVVGWVGRLIPRPVPREEAAGRRSDVVGLSGTGVVLIDGG